MALPQPTLQARVSAGLSFLTDEPLFRATGVRMGFSRRQGGVSEPPYDGLNLGTHVGDDAAAVAENRVRLQGAAGLGGTALLTLNQVHGNRVLALPERDAAVFSSVTAAAEEGADGVAVAAPGVTALLCFADCTPVIVVSPTGAFAVAHAGWRGALAGIPAEAVQALVALDDQVGAQTSPADFNAYIGPHICPSCYECGAELVGRFVDRFGPACAHEGDHLNLEAAVRASLAEAGVACDRIAAAGECTACCDDRYFSYRKSGGCCGRHSAFAGRKE
ncbi:polyphenol oxidase family protein [Adlercreutzia sp. R7]|uniref:Polyphenol oxidase family protein n=1 Tax=Adlercreutzia wanghongyangiae TaxID=3111451 RepID=A0ABU6IIV5_9ACTN|nr:polyphenol oxidase family protein [Adlercreutzia sp. R7]